MSSLLFDPWIGQRLWRRALVGARQPLRLDFNLDEIRNDGARTAVRQESAPIAPLAKLRSFKIDAPTREERRQVLLAPPFSGAFSILMRDVVAWMLPHADVHVIEWLNVARALDATTSFNFDDQIGVVLRALRRVGPEAHLVALCQGGPPALIATAVLGADAPESAPASVALMSAPLKPSAAPSIVSESIRARTLSWYRMRLSKRISADTGAHRLIYPAEAQLNLMMSTLASQSPARDELSRLISRDDGDDPSKLSFLEIVTAYMDLPAEHFLSSLDRIYLSEDGPLAPMRWRNRVIPPEALSSVSLASIEGGQDRVAAPGQTSSVVAALPSDDGVVRRKIVIEDLGHFGLFYGSGWRDAVAPRILAFMQRVERAKTRSPAERPTAPIDQPAPRAASI